MTTLPKFTPLEAFEKFFPPTRAGRHRLDRMEHPCPGCGHDGPHPVVAREIRKVTLECAGCHHVIEVTQ